MSDSLHPIEASPLHAKRERVFLVLAGIFLGTMTMLNILGISRFIVIGDMEVAVEGGDPWQIAFAVAVGVLPYPITFLCTDFISEFYGRRRANWVVFVGLMLNLWVIFIMWLGGELPGFESVAARGIELDVLNPATPDGEIVRDAAGRLPVFYEIRGLTFGAVTASMIAYIAAQFCDVYLFHFFKRLTKGKHLWLRNNGSTLVSQLVDTVAVILITHYATEGGLPMHPGVDEGLQILVYIGTGYAFKVAVALIDTGPFYLGVRVLSKVLEIDPTEHPDAEKSPPKSPEEAV